jgi:hypothetical protein
MSNPQYAPLGDPFPQPGNQRRKAGKPSYEELEQSLCGLIGEITVGKRRTITPEMQIEFAAMGGCVVKEKGDIIVLCDMQAVVAHYQSS